MSPVRNAFVSRQSRIPPGPPKFIQLIFPGIKSDSFLMYLMMAQALIYIVTLCVGEHLLNPTADSLITCGASTFNLTFREFQFWRLFTSIFLMANVESLIFISWIQWTMGAETELKYGKIKTAAIVFVGLSVEIIICHILLLRCVNRLQYLKIPLVSSDTRSDNCTAIHVDSDGVHCYWRCLPSDDSVWFQYYVPPKTQRTH
eukprot:GHVH01015854.1.p1 GENE.GHVH01015854.1~~GHVH01015854.1.p1  ORF type:complete len:202 (+),score=12.91 GHVH01015854.1:173-778(+)